MTVRVERCLPDGFLAEALRADARAGLSASPKVLPPKWFYDERGSELFEKITHLDEYYPTRAERSILRATAGQIAAGTRAQTLVELGAGAADKTRLLLDAMAAEGTLASFVPVDVSEGALIEAARRVDGDCPGLADTAVVSDFEEHLGLPLASGSRLVVFLGGTIGNLLPGQRAAFLASLRSRLRPGDAFLLGTDLVKDPARGLDQRRLADVHRDEAGQRALGGHRVEQQPGLVGCAGAELHQGLRPGSGGDLPCGGAQDGPLGPGRVVLVEVGDLLEQFAAPLVVEPLRRERLGAG